MQRQSSIGATQHRKWRCLSSARSTEQTCAADAANKNKAVAADESFRQSAQRIHASRLDQRNQAQTKSRRLPTGERQPAKQSMATSQTTRFVAASLCRGAPVAIATIRRCRCQEAEKHKQSG